jgi:DnaJ-class molecular chaperone
VTIRDQDALNFAQRLDDLDYYGLLGVERSARTLEIRSAFHLLRRKFHPDNYLSAEEQIRNAVDHIARRVSEAYVVLRHPSRRQAYDRGLERGATRLSRQEEKSARKSSETQLGTTAQGRRLIAQARDAERRGDTKGAISSLKLAMGLEPSNPHIKAKLEDLKKSL